MKQLKFKVIISSEHEKIEKLFSTRKDVADYLEIPESTVYSLTKKTAKYKASKLKKLENILVERLDVFYHSKPKADNQAHEEYINRIMKKN